MTDNTPQATPEQVEIERLRTHSAELLAELKEARATLKRQAADLEAATAERDQARTELDDLRLGQPVRAMLERISTAPDVLKTMLDARGYRFTHEDGRIVMRDAEGNVPQIHDTKEPRDATFTADDVSNVLCESWVPRDKRNAAALAFASLIVAPNVSGGGAPGGSSRPAPAGEREPITAHKPVTFGLK